MGRKSWIPRDSTFAGWGPNSSQNPYITKAFGVLRELDEFEGAEYVRTLCKVEKGDELVAAFIYQLAE